MSPRAHLEQHMVQRTGRVVLLRWEAAGGGDVWWWCQVVVVSGGGGEPHMGEVEVVMSGVCV